MDNGRTANVQSKSSLNETPIKKKKSLSINHADDIIGEWSSASAIKYHILSTKIKKSGKGNYVAVSDLADGGVYTEYLTFDSSGKYQTYNEYGEYYELSNDNLEFYDNDGFLFSLNYS